MTGKNIYLISGERNCSKGAIEENGGLYANVGETDRNAIQRTRDEDYRRKQLGGKITILKEWEITQYSLSDRDIHKQLKMHPRVKWEASDNTEEFLFLDDKGDGSVAIEIIENIIIGLLCPSFVVDIICRLKQDADFSHDEERQKLNDERKQLELDRLAYQREEREKLTGERKQLVSDRHQLMLDRQAYQHEEREKLFDEREQLESDKLKLFEERQKLYDEREQLETGKLTYQREERQYIIDERKRFIEERKQLQIDKVSYREDKADRIRDLLNVIRDKDEEIRDKNRTIEHLNKTESWRLKRIDAAQTRIDEAELSLSKKQTAFSLLSKVTIAIIIIFYFLYGNQSSLISEKTGEIESLNALLLDKEKVIKSQLDAINDYSIKSDKHYSEFARCVMNPKSITEKDRENAKFYTMISNGEL